MPTNYLRYLMLACILTITNLSFGQLKDVGIPDIQHFSKQEYRGSAQNWHIASNQSNFMYFANNDGVLEFDGNHWQLYGLPNRSIVRALQIDDNGRIYVGQQNDFGYMEPDAKGELQYRSLLDLVAVDERNFEEIWCIHLTSFGVVFQSYTHLFIYRNEAIVSVPLSNRIRFSFYVNGHLWVQDEVDGLCEYRQGHFFKLKGLDELDDKEIWAILPVYNNRVLIGTANHGVYSYDGEKLTPWKGPANDFLLENQIFSATRFNEAYYAFGTIQGGLLITDESGQIIQHVNKKKGLQNNTILSIGADQEGNLWLGLDNGIDYIDVGSPFTFMFDPEGLGATYTSLVHNGKLYVGTNHGLYVKDWPEDVTIDPKGFRLIPKTIGQVWYLGVHNGVVLCGHDNGTYEIAGETARMISDVRGAWIFIELMQNDDYLLGGNYNGLTLFRKTADGQSWEFVTQVKDFSESSKLMAQDENGDIWMSHGFKGVFRMRLNEALDRVVHYDFYNSNDGLPSDIYINLMTIKGDILFTSPNGIYTYDQALNRFERSVEYNKLFGEGNNVDYIKEDQYNNIWFIGENGPGVLRFLEDGSYTKVVGPFEKIAGLTISGFQHINVVDMEHTFISLEDGLAHYSPSYQPKKDRQEQVYIREVVNQLNQKRFHPNLMDENFPEDSLAFKFKGNNLKFVYSSPDYKNLNRIRFSYFLENYSTEWSEWSEEASSEFMNLREGDYTFKVKTVNPFGHESQPASFSFSIKPPWYRSALAWFVYMLSGLLLIAAIIWWVYYRMQVSKRKERLKNLQEYRKRIHQYQREVLVSEREIVKLRNEKLRGKMIHLDKELANQTMSLVQKNKFMGKLKTELKSLQTLVTDSTVKSKISLIISRIDREFDNKKQQELFETYFDEVHEDFFKRLTEKFPTLTPREQKLCAYIKMNISTKEIATLQNISSRGVEIGRYRLRKKLGLDRDTNLSSFIASI
ncbi:triple tyrosine motif-containing protein [uncultured Sunxiuqinia sp.]|uniref:ligand-binding sensor domain-containing protein n=1 Tax=uncultured Sunxiuqinia sp. TaxID=1573825 RepID=UPI002608E12E|nr:triple tyrosine motif-containing protein [uncultured Sunxiuqinia sp.]